MARILRRPQAADDIDQIWDYIAEDSDVQADAWVDQGNRTNLIQDRGVERGRHRR
jgi:plasmid stabilization system protein ParE